MKKFKKKKTMWQQVATDLKGILSIDKTAVQCENRFKTIMKRKKTADSHNGRTGESPIPLEYKHEIAKIAAVDDSISPEVQMGVGQCVLRKNLLPSSDSEPEPSKLNKKAPRTSISKTLWDIQKFKEEQRTIRHKEKMELLKEIGEKLCQNKK